MDLRMKRTTPPACNAMGDHWCEACGSGSLDVVSRIIVVETFRESVPCRCGESKEAAHSITELETRHISRVSLVLWDHPALPEDWVDEWIERDGGVLQEVVSCHCCAEKADWASSERFVEAATQRLETELACRSCGHKVGFEPTTFGL